MKRTILIGGINIGHDASVRISTEAEFRKAAACDFVKETTQQVRNLIKGQGSAPSWVSFDEKIKRLKTCMPLCIPNFSEDHVKDWLIRNTHYAGFLVLDVDKDLPPGTTPQMIFDEMQAQYTTAGKQWKGRIVMVAESISGGGRTKVIVKIPHDESRLNPALDLDEEKHFLGKYLIHLDVGCRATNNRPFYIPREEDILYLDWESFIDIEPDWWAYIQTQLALAQTRNTPGWGAQTRVVGQGTATPCLVGTFPSPVQQPPPALGDCEEAVKSFFRDFISGQQTEALLQRQDSCGRNNKLYGVALRLRWIFKEHGADAMADALKPYTALSDREVEEVCRNAFKAPWPLGGADLHIRKLKQRFGCRVSTVIFGQSWL